MRADSWLKSRQFYGFDRTQNSKRKRAANLAYKLKGRAERRKPFFSLKCMAFHFPTIYALSEGNVLLVLNNNEGGF